MPGAAGDEPRLDLAVREGHVDWQSRNAGTDGEGGPRAGVDSDMVKGYPAAQNQTLQVSALEGSVQGSGGYVPAEQARAASRRHRCCVGRARRQRAVCSTRLLLHERVDPPTGRVRWLDILFCPYTGSPLTAEWAVLVRYSPSVGASGRDCDGSGLGWQQ